LVQKLGQVTPPFIDRDEYHRSRQWKLNLHAAHGTTLIETFSHEKAAGKLTTTLSEKLVALGIKLAPISPETMFQILEQQGRIDPFTRLVATFLQHFKGSQLSIKEAARRATKLSDRPRGQAFVEIFRPIFERYQSWLVERKQIDFHDMINRATDLVENGHYDNPHNYILVDEFQDISSGRARLLKALLDKKAGAQLFVVGDDWQAIYRFAGSDIAVMREFSERFGASERMDLSTTFRCPEAIASAAAKFVLKNPAQLRKKVLSIRTYGGPCLNVFLRGTEDSDHLTEALRLIDKDAAGVGEPASVLILGRYKHLRPANIADLKMTYPNLNISYMTDLTEFLNQAE